MSHHLPEAYQLAIRNNKDLAGAIERGEDYIEIEGDLANRVIRIRAAGKVAWVIAVGAIGIAVTATILAVPTGGTSEAIGFIAAPAALAVLGGPATYAAIAVAVCAGSVGALTRLRGYKEISRSDGRLVLARG
jgi:hypothetical protein